MMKEKSIPAAPNEHIHIGKIIEAELRRQERSVTWLSRKLHCDRRNIYHIFSREYIDTGLLLRISLVLGRDFFAYFSANLQHIENQSITPPNKRLQKLTVKFGHEMILFT